MPSFLCQAESYVKQIEFLHQKAFENFKLFKDISQSESLMTIYPDRKRIAKILAKQIQQGQYQPKPPIQRYVQVKDKKRLIYLYGLIDKIVIGAIYSEITKLLEPQLSKNCYAFRKNFNCHKVIKNLSTYLRKHQSQPIFFYKTDVKSYFDTIPVDNQSLLWQQLSDLLATKIAEKIDKQGYFWQLIIKFVRPASFNLDGLLQSNLIGTATGVSFTAMLSNLYLSELDHMISAIPDIFYARFVDDIFICHTDAGHLEAAKNQLHQHIKKLRLSLKSEKDLQGTFSPTPSCPLQQQQREFKHYASINYLGYKIFSDGLYCFSTSQQRKFLHKAYLMINNIIATNKNLSAENLGKRVCSHVSNYLICSETKYLNRNIYMATNSHQQLKRLDYLIALHIAKKISGVSGAKAFRTIPYKKIRQQWRLKSLCQLRNHSKEYYEQLKPMASPQAEIA